MPIVVVIVEDEEPLMRIYARALKLHKFEVVEFLLGRSALAYMLDGDNRADLLIVDIHLKDMDGIDLASQVRASGYAGPILISSGWLQENTDRLSIGGFVSQLQKPVTISEFIAAVKKATQPQEELSAATQSLIGASTQANE